MIGDCASNWESTGAQASPSRRHGSKFLGHDTPGASRRPRRSCPLIGGSHKLTSPERERWGGRRAPLYRVLMQVLAYFLTWTTYGTWLRGDSRGSIVDDSRVGMPVSPKRNALRRHDEKLLTQSPVILKTEARLLVERTIREVCHVRSWVLHALNCRTNHVHVVLSARITPERVLVQLKAWSTRRLREAGFASSDDRVWTKHGSTRYLTDHTSAMAAVWYVENQ